MGELFHPNIEHSSSPTEVQAGVIFVDLDKTFLDGTVINMTDEELVNAGLIANTLTLVRRANDLGIPVVMVTRNSMELIERFFAAKPELRCLFDETIPCETGQKSEPIKSFLTNNQIDPKKAIFVDDTAGELADVESNSEGTIAIKPQETGDINLKSADAETSLTKIEVRKKIKRLLALYPLMRQKIVNWLKSSFADADYVNLTA